jgi:hypothetical protein
MTELQKRLRAKIEEVLDLCDYNETPTVCRMVKDREGRRKVVELVEVYVVSDGYRIGDAIARIEQEYNINLTD